MKRNFNFAAFIATVILVGCGGGGGGSDSSSGYYAGTWDMTTVRVINDCSLPIGSTFSASLLVNQDGDRIVVNSGSQTLSGNTNNEDGFSVTNVTGPDANGCMTGANYTFKNASDGNADVGVALLVRCGTGECAVGFGGSAVKQSSRTLSKSLNEATDLTNLRDVIESGVAAGKGDVGRGTVQEAVEALADVVTPVN